MNIDDPRLTAYALDELDEHERIEIEALLKDDAVIRQEVERLRHAGTVLTERLDAEPCPRLEPEQRLAIHAQIPEPSPSFWREHLWLLTGLGATAMMLLVAALFPVIRPAMKQSGQLAMHKVEPAEQPATPEIDTAATGGNYNYSGSTFGSGGGIAGGDTGGMSGKFKPTVEFEGGSPLALAAPPASPADGNEIGAVIVNGGAIAKLYAGNAESAIGLKERRVDFYSGTTFGQRLAPTSSDAIQAYGLQREVPEFQNRRSWIQQPPAISGTESYATVRENQFVSVSDQPLSTFGLDVDTASYANVRRFLSQGQLPPRDAVRIEEMLNYFSYDYPRPRGNEPFALYVEMAECPWNPSHRLALVGLKAKDIAPRKMQPMNLVFLLDVSGSMADANKLPLVKQGMRLLVEQLTGRDRVAIVVYANNARIVLPSTRGDDHEAILEAIDSLQADGGTNGGEGIQWAYRQATSNFIQGGVNRVILCTDGDFNVGITDQGDLVHLIEQQARSGVFLSVFGFGMGNLKDSTMQKLADKGNGHYAYIDDIGEARKMLVDQMRSTLVTVAKDAKLQVEFNPALVDSYRLIGYEKRMLRAQDFNNDRKDAGEVGAGHTVTALYEIVPAGVTLEPGVDPLKYQSSSRRSTGAELMTVKLRYKEPDAGKSQLLTAAVKDTQTSWRHTSDDFRFAAAVACFGMTLRDSEYRGGATYDLALQLSFSARNRDQNGQRSEFMNLVSLARGLAVRDP